MIQPTRSPAALRRFAMLCVLGLTALSAREAAAATVTRGPYLQMPTPNSVIVRWRTDVPTDSRVSRGSAPGSLSVNVDDPAVGTEHVVTVNGLSPDTRYYYSIGDTTAPLEGDDANHFFNTAPTAGTVRPVRIWATGDGGFANANGIAVRDAYATYSAGNTTDLWFLLGDNAYPIGTDSDYQAALYGMHHDLLRSVPVYSTFGNHEAFSSNSLTQTGPYFDMFSFPTGGQAGGVPSGTESYYSFDYANVHVIVLDANSSSTLAGSPMRLWLDADLQATSADWIIAMWHHPPYSRGLFHNSDTEGRLVEMRTNILPVLESYGVDLVLCGHSHNYERSYFLDGHYGLASTFNSSFQKDSGDGSATGDGAYRKPEGQTAHAGAVYVVAGSSSEVRNTTLDHPAHLVNLLQLGSMVVDIDGNVLTASFLNSSAQVADRFQIVKGSPCPATAATGCNPGVSGRIDLRKSTLGADRDSMSWTLKTYSIDAADVGDPTQQADLAVCVYDATGNLIGGGLPRGSRWTVRSSGARVYKDRSRSASGLGSVSIRPKPSGLATIRASGRGANLAMPTLPVTAPVKAQLVNLDNGACWQSDFASLDLNNAKHVVGVRP